MSWALELDNEDRNGLGNDDQWKPALMKVENSLKTIETLYDDLKMRFDYIKNSQIDMNEIELKRQALNPRIEELSEYLKQLTRMLPTIQNTATTAKKNQIKDLRFRAAALTSSVQTLCASINTELSNRQLSRQNKLSVISSESGSGDRNRDDGRQIQLSTIDDSQIQLALEEQRQTEKIAQDMKTLEDIFAYLSEMVQEDGETVNRIGTNVDEAHNDTGTANKELVKAEEYKKAALRRKLYILGIIIAVLVVVGLIIGLSVGLKR